MDTNRDEMTEWIVVKYTLDVPPLLPSLRHPTVDYNFNVPRSTGFDELVCRRIWQKIETDNAKILELVRKVTPPKYDHFRTFVLTLWTKDLSSGIVVGTSP